MTAVDLWAGEDFSDTQPHLAPIPEQRNPQLFRRYSAAELDAMPTRFEWLVKGMFARPTYGMAGGPAKTTKSTVLDIITVGVAAGLPIFGRFNVPQAGPVLRYVGEGGRIPTTRRDRRIAAAYGLNLADLPIHTVFDVAPIPSPLFRASLIRDLGEVEPVLTVLDPLYAYHGTDTKASSLHEEGSLLTGLSNACVAADSSLVVVNHFNKTGNGQDLSRFTMTGGAEWSDSWLLLNHRTDPDVAGGRFWLTLTCGSRQWGGTTWDLDLTLGRFDPDIGEHDGDITWEIRPSNTGHATEADHAADVLNILEEHPWELTHEGLVTAAGGKATTTRTIIDSLLQAGQITAQKVKRQEGNRWMTRNLYALATEPRPDNGRSWTDNDQ